MGKKNYLWEHLIGKVRSISISKLSVEEQSFIDNEVQQLCSMLDEWKIHHKDKNLPPEVWQFIKDKGFLGLIIPKSFGGKQFSAFAQSRIMSKIASRSLTAAVVVYTQLALSR